MIALIASAIALTNIQQVSVESGVRVVNNTPFRFITGWSAVSPSSLPEFKRRPRVDHHFGTQALGTPVNAGPFSATSGAVSVENWITTSVVAVLQINKQKVVAVEQKRPDVVDSQ